MNEVMAEPPTKMRCLARVSTVENYPHINDLPIEVLTEIFKVCVRNEGTFTLFRLAKVCPLWKQLALNYSMWTVIDDKRITMRVLLWLCNKGLLKNTVELNLSYICNDSNREELETISQHCPKLRTLNLSNVKNFRLSLQGFVNNCCEIKRLIIKNSMQNIPGDFCNLYSNLLQNVTYLNLSENFIVNAQSALKKIAAVCPNLCELYLDKVSGTCLVFPVSTFMEMCKNLTVISLQCFDLNVSNCPKQGFPKLKVFMCPSIEQDVRDKILWEVLKGSSELKILDIRGTQVTSQGLLNINVPNLESLSISCTPAVTCEKLSEVLMKWQHSLKHLNLSKCVKQSTEQAVLKFVSGKEESQLEELNVSQSAISFNSILKIISKCSKLRFLNLEACRSIPRGKRRIYRSSLEIQAMFGTVTKAAKTDAV